MSSTSPSSLRLKILSDPANLAGVRQAVEALCGANGFERRICDDVGLCVNEAMANVIRHAYGGATDKAIEIGAQVVDDEIRISIRDWGNGVNPMDVRTRPHDPLRPGGLGMVCLKGMMDQVKFTAPSDGGILLEMTRKKQLHA